MESRRIERKKAPNLPRVVGSARNEFGTRLCHRVECGKCGQIDHVPVRVNQGQDKFCRSCAEKHLMAYEQGRKIDEKKFTVACEQCHLEFKAVETLVSKKERLLCIDCLRGFDVWRGKIAAPSKNNAKRRIVLTKLGARTTFRKNIHDTI